MPPWSHPDGSGSGPCSTRSPPSCGTPSSLRSCRGSKNDTLVLGLGARLRMSDGAYLVAEVTPRLAGYAGNRGSGDPGTQAAFGIEGRVGGHVFQFNVSNLLGTTPAQTARGRQGRSDWYIGFNLSRKFY